MVMTITFNNELFIKINKKCACIIIKQCIDYIHNILLLQINYL